MQTGKDTGPHLLPPPTVRVPAFGHPLPSYMVASYAALKSEEATAVACAHTQRHTLAAGSAAPGCVPIDGCMGSLAGVNGNGGCTVEQRLHNAPVVWRKMALPIGTSHTLSSVDGTWRHSAVATQPICVHGMKWTLNMQVGAWTRLCNQDSARYGWMGMAAAGPPDVDLHKCSQPSGCPASLNVQWHASRFRGSGTIQRRARLQNRDWHLLMWGDHCGRKLLATAGIKPNGKHKS
ncbi:hypothetical protein B0H14DRAFT_2597227 [Mycena olivaceomarginata]|nr:hypothetical protein B0H14DRAFT_2597227 [Mycena olivaceomarginata]